MLAPLGFRLWRHRGEGLSRAHAHLDLELNFLTEGGLRYFIGGRFHDLRVSTFTLFWAGIPHATVEDVPRRGIWATFPLDWALESRHLGPLCQRLLQGEIVEAPQADEEDDLRRLRRWLTDFESGDPMRLAALQLELEGRLIRLQNSPALPAQGAASRGSRAQFERVTALVATGYTDPDLRTEHLAAELKLHPKYLLRLFRQRAGMTLWEYVTQLRIAHARRLQLMTEMTILETALEAGFGSSSAYYDALKRFEPMKPV